MSVILLALASGIGAWWVRQTFVWTPLQQFYLSAYARSALASSLAIPTARYRLLLMENRRGSRLAIDEEVVPMSSPSGDTTFALSELARQAGSGRLVWRDLVVNHARVHADLGVWIYRNQTLADLLAWNHELCRAVTGAALHTVLGFPHGAHDVTASRRPERPNPRCVRGGGAESARYANSQTAQYFLSSRRSGHARPGPAATQFLGRPGEASRPTREAARGSFVPVTGLARAAP